MQVRYFFLFGVILWIAAIAGCLTAKPLPRSPSFHSPTTRSALVGMRGKIQFKGVKLYLVTPDGKSIQLDPENIIDTPVTVYGVPEEGSTPKFHAYEVRQ